MLAIVLIVFFILLFLGVPIAYCMGIASAAALLSQTALPRRCYCSESIFHNGFLLVNGDSILYARRCINECHGYYKTIN